MKPTPAQTIGPFFHRGLLGDRAALDVATDGMDGVDGLVLEGRVLDGTGGAVTDGMLELWQADGRGGGLWARSGTDAAGGYRFTTARPVELPHPTGAHQAPHVLLLVFARGLLDHLITRVYLPESRLSEDPVLATVPPDRRHTLVATRSGRWKGLPRYRFDVRLQGPDETVFFEV